MAQYIPEQHYLGVPQRAHGEYPLGFMTPYGTDSAAKKRMETVDNWCGKNSEFKVLDNKPMTGFKVGEEVRRWRTSNVVWRIQDPRKFELEISSGNMAYLLSECTIHKGEFQDELEWCRDGKDNYLLPVGSEEHQKYNKNSTALASNLTLKDINPGDEIKLMDGAGGVYLGGYYLVIFGAWNSTAQNIIKVQRRQILRTKGGNFLDRSTFKNFTIVKKGKPEDNRDYAAEIDPRRTSAGSNGIAISKTPVKAQDIIETLELVPITPRRIADNTDTISFLVEHTDDKLYEVSGYGRHVYLYALHINTEINEFSRDQITTHRNQYNYSSNHNLSEDVFKEIVRSKDKAVTITATINGVRYDCYTGEVI